MSVFDQLEREWESMMNSRDVKRGLVRWTDPALARFETPQQLVNFLQERQHPVENDAVLRPLVALARTDALAARTVLQAMLPGIRSVRRAYTWADTRKDVESTTISTAFEKICLYPLDRRPNRIAANIVADTKRALWEKYVNVGGEEVPSGGFDDMVQHENEHDYESEPPFESACAAIRDAVRDGVVSKADGRLIIETRLFGRSFDEIAQSQNIITKSLRRRRERAEADIRAAEIPLPM